jgi:toxin CptA
MPLYTIQASRRWRQVHLTLHGLASVALLLADLAWAWRAVGLALVSISLGRAWRPMPTVSVRHDAGHGLEWLGPDAWRVVTVCPGSLVTPWICVLRLRTDTGHVQNVLILPDSLHADDFRRLRVWLRWRAPIGEGAVTP